MDDEKSALEYFRDAYPKNHTSNNRTPKSIESVRYGGKIKQAELFDFEGRLTKPLLRAHVPSGYFGGKLYVGVKNYDPELDDLSILVLDVTDFAGEVQK